MLNFSSKVRVHLATILGKYLHPRFIELLPDTLREYTLTLKVEYGYEEYFRYVVYPSLVVSLGLDKYINLPISIEDIIVNEELPETARPHLKMIIEKMENAGLVTNLGDKLVFKNKLEIRYSNNIELTEKYERLSPSSWQAPVNSFKEAIYSKRVKESEKIAFSNTLSARQVKSLLSILKYNSYSSAIYLGCSYKVLDVILSSSEKIREVQVYCGTKKSKSVLKGLREGVGEQVKIGIIKDFNMIDSKSDLIVITDDLREFYDEFELLIEIAVSSLNKGKLAIVVGSFSKGKKTKNKIKLKSKSTLGQFEFEPSKSVEEVTSLLTGKVEKFGYFFKKRFFESYLALAFVK